METLLRRKHYFQSTRRLSALLLGKSQSSFPVLGRIKNDNCNIVVRSISTQADPKKSLLGTLFGPESNTASPEFRSRWLMVKNLQKYKNILQNFIPECNIRMLSRPYQHSPRTCALDPLMSANSNFALMNL